MRIPICLVAACLAARAAPADEPSYRHYVSGNAADVVTATRGLVVMQGGGDDVDENYVRMGEFAGGGDFVVLRASGADEYGDYVLALCGCDSVETLVFSAREAAFDPFVVGRIRDAEAVFIAGGDQSKYVRLLDDTPVEDAILAVAAKPAPIGGTSAGMAVMGGFVYSAMSDASLMPEVALHDPYHADVTLTRDFLPLPALAGIVTDQHLVERDRMGRTVAMLARIVADGWTTRARAIAADRETAVHVDPASGAVTVHATDDHETPHVYFLETTAGRMTVEPGAPLTIEGVAVYRLAPGGRFDLDSWQGTGGLAYALGVVDGELRSSRGEIY